VEFSDWSYWRGTGAGIMGFAVGQLVMTDNIYALLIGLVVGASLFVVGFVGGSRCTASHQALVEK